MTRFLLDVTVLIALLDPTHVSHDAANSWFSAERNVGWATCPLTENGAVRVLSQKSYPNALATPALAINYLRSLCSLAGHSFWPDDVSLLQTSVADSS